MQTMQVEHLSTLSLAFITHLPYCGRKVSNYDQH